MDRPQTSWLQSVWTLLVAVASIIAIAPSGHALVALEFDPPVATPGTVVTATTLGAALAQDPQGYRLYLARSQRLADKLAGREGPPSDPRLTPIGRLLPDDEGVGTITFTVPDLKPGRYAAVAYCPTCDNDGSTFSAVGELKIASVGTLPMTGASLIALVPAVTALMCVAIALLVVARH
ncbi:MAG: hypothetical protein ACRDKT_13580 [Actinomycetota bacterium]